MPERVIVIGIGNDMRGDDGVGIHVVRQLTPYALQDVQVIEASGEGTALMDAWSDTETAILVDAVLSGAEPGTVYRLDLQGKPVPSSLRAYSTHAFGVAQAVELARTLDSLPPRLILYGIEGTAFDFGASLSPTVARAAQKVVRQILVEIGQQEPANHG